MIVAVKQNDSISISLSWLSMVAVALFTTSAYFEIEWIATLAQVMTVVVLVMYSIAAAFGLGMWMALRSGRTKTVQVKYSPHPNNPWDVFWQVVLLTGLIVFEQWWLLGWLVIATIITVFVAHSLKTILVRAGSIA